MSGEKKKTRTAPQWPLHCHLKRRVQQEEDLFSPSDHHGTQTLSPNISVFSPNDLMLQDHQWPPKSWIYQQFSHVVSSIQNKLFANSGLISPLCCSHLHLCVVGEVLGYTTGMLSLLGEQDTKIALGHLYGPSNTGLSDAGSIPQCNFKQPLGFHKLCPITHGHKGLSQQPKLTRQGHWPHCPFPQPCPLQ